MSEKLQLPAFASEAEEATWWYDNREAHAEEFAKAIREGRARRSTLAQRLAEARAIDLDPEDETKARQIATNRGMDYKTYLKHLVHEALAQEHHTERLAGTDHDRA